LRVLFFFFILSQDGQNIILRSFGRPSLRAYGNILALSTCSEPLNKQKEKRRNKNSYIQNSFFLKGRKNYQKSNEIIMRKKEKK
jgi:hypothetical protein